MRIVNIRRNELEIQYLSELMAYVFIAIEIDRAWKARGEGRGGGGGGKAGRANRVEHSNVDNRVSSALHTLI